MYPSQRNLNSSATMVLWGSLPVSRQLVRSVAGESYEWVLKALKWHRNMIITVKTSWSKRYNPPFLHRYCRSVAPLIWCLCRLPDLPLCENTWVSPLQHPGDPQVCRDINRQVANKESDSYVFHETPDGWLLDEILPLKYEISHSLFPSLKNYSLNREASSLTIQVTYEKQLKKWKWTT